MLLHVPRIATLDGLALYIYAGDHNPPHFHVIGADEAALIEIGTLVVLEGELASSGLRVVLTWASQNGPLLMTEWNRLNP